MLVPNKNGTSSDYRFGFQGQEMDNELKGEGNSLNYTFRMHDPRVGRFFAPDPLEPKYPFYSPYQFSGNRVIDMVELEGLEPANTKVNADSQPKGDNWEKTNSAGNYTGEAYPATELAEVTVRATKNVNVAAKALRSMAVGVNEVFGAMTGASSISNELNAAYNSDYAPATDGKSVAITYGILAAPIAAAAAVEASAGAGIVASYEAYSAWYAGTALSSSISNLTVGSISSMFIANSTRAKVIGGFSSFTSQYVVNGFTLKAMDWGDVGISSTMGGDGGLFVRSFTNYSFEKGFEVNSFYKTTLNFGFGKWAGNLNTSFSNFASPVFKLSTAMGTYLETLSQSAVKVGTTIIKKEVEAKTTDEKK